MKISLEIIKVWLMLVKQSLDKGFEGRTTRKELFASKKCVGGGLKSEAFLQNHFLFGRGCYFEKLEYEHCTIYLFNWDKHRTKYVQRIVEKMRPEMDQY